MVATVVQTPLRAAIGRGRAWELSINALDPTGADDIFAYFKNAGKASLEFPDLEIGSTVAGNVEPQRVTGTAAGGTKATTNLANLGGGGAKPDAIVETGVDITGLTKVFDHGHYYLIIDTPRQIELPCIRIKTGEALAFNWEVATGILSGSIRVFEVAPEDEG